MAGKVRRGNRSWNVSGLTTVDRLQVSALTCPRVP